MKKTALLICFVIITMLLASCIFDLNFTETSHNVSDVSKLDQEEESVQESESLPEVSEASDETSFGDMSSMSSAELFEYASAKSEAVDSFTQEIEQTTIFDMGTNGQNSITLSLRSKADGLQGEDPVFSAVYNDGALTQNFYFKNNKGYYNTNNVRFSFDCTCDELRDYSALVSFNQHGGEDEAVIELQDYIYNSAVVMPNSDGGYNILFEDEISHDMFAAFIGSGQDSLLDRDKPVTCAMFSYITDEGYLVSDVLNFSFTLTVDDISTDVQIISTSLINDINENVNVNVVESGYTHVGDIAVMYAMEGYNFLAEQDSYKCDIDIKYEVNGYSLNDNVSYDIEVFYAGADNNKMAYASKYMYNGTRYNYYYYFENDYLYIKYPGETSYETEEIKYEFSSDVAFSFWLFCGIEMTSINGIVYEDNGDGTATLSYSLTESLVTDYADIYLAQTYGEDYYGFFANNSDSVKVNEAKVFVMVDNETGVILSHNYKIEARFLVEGETVTYKETVTQTFETEGVAVPDKNVFMGTSDL